MWSLFRRASRRGTYGEDLLSVYRDHGVLPRDAIEGNWNRIPEDLTNYQLVLAGDLVLNKMKAWQGSLGISPVRGIVSPAYFVYSPTGSGACARFLHYQLRSRPFVEAYGRISDGIRIDQWDLDPWAFSRMKVFLPPLNEQVAIADFLDRETAKIDTLIEKQRALLEALERRVALGIREAVTRNSSEALRPSGAWCGPLPGHWSEKRISWLFSETASGTTPAPEAIQPMTADLIPWVNTAELRESVITATVRGLEPSVVEATGALRVFPTGSILVAMYGATIGRLGVLGVPATTNQACLALVEPRGDVHARFIFYSLWGARDHLLLLADGGGQPNLNQDKIRRIRVPLPPHSEQMMIAERLDRLLQGADLLAESIRTAISLAQERRSALITAAVTGQFSVGRAA